MIKKVIITNYLGESMEYNIEGVQPENESGLLITSIEGLGPVKANINMTDPATTDGQLYNSARLTGRNIVIKGVFTHASSIEEARLLSYRYFPIKKKLKFHIETDNRTAETEGYVESNEPDIFSEQEGCQISILCEKAYLDGGVLEYTDIANIDYPGDAEAGVEIELQIGNEVVTPVDTISVTGEITIANESNNELKVDLSKMSGLVPNTSPRDIPACQCSFIYGQSDIYKFLKKLPIESTYIGSNSKYSAFVYNNEIHAFAYLLDGISYGRAKHYKWTGSDWIEESLDGFSHDSIIWYVLEYEGDMYVIARDYVHISEFVITAALILFKYSGTSWEQVSHTVRQEVVDNRGVAIGFDGKIQILAGTRRLLWHIQDERWEVISDLPVTVDSKSSAVVYNGYLHIIVYVYDSSTRINMTKIYKYDGSAWSQLSSHIFDSSGSTCIVFNDELHLFGGTSSNGRHKVSTNLSTWTDLSTIPYSCAYTGVCVFGGYLYLIGSTFLQTYTEAPNNDHLIENDKLTVNTITGKKSIYLDRGGNHYNVLNILEDKPTWFTLKRGENSFTIEATEGTENINPTIKANKWYQGV